MERFSFHAAKLGIFSEFGKKFGGFFQSSYLCTQKIINKQKKERKRP